MAKLYSKRGFLLVDDPGSTPTLTVELYCKWYKLFLVQSDGWIEEIPFPDDKYEPLGESPYLDHVPNPNAVQNYARVFGYEIGELALEMMIGRWALERAK